MANRYAHIKIGPGGAVSVNDARAKVTAATSNLVVWIVKNESGQPATAFLSDWVIGKTPGVVGSGTPVDDPVNWIFPDTDGVVDVANGKKQPLIGFVTAAPPQGQLYSSTLTVVVNGVSHQFDPDLEIPPPGGSPNVPPKAHGGGPNKPGKGPQKKRGRKAWPRPRSA